MLAVVLTLCALAVIMLKLIDREAEPESAAAMKTSDSAQN
jgi:hypothetical protein